MYATRHRFCLSTRDLHLTWKIVTGKNSKVAMKQKTIDTTAAQWLLWHFWAVELLRGVSTPTDWLTGIVSFS